MIKINKENRWAMVMSLVYAFVLLFFLSHDSYLYDLYLQSDTAAFFICGKAWMCGMIPYVDFADSKGPLLWLIYGVGYLISHHSYIGVFWISVLFYTVTLFTAYKLCRLFVDKDVAKVSTAILPLFLFFFIFNPSDTKCEEFCYTFIMLSLYCTCKILKNRDTDAKTYFRLSALTGVCSMCCMLIKYNIGCMIMGLMAVELYMAIRHKAGWQSFAGMTAGFVVPAIPFVICFLIYGNLGAFVQEYFIHTFETIEAKGITHMDWFFEGQTTPIKKLLVLISTLAALLVILFGTVWFCRKQKIGMWLVPCFFLFIIGLGTLVTVAYWYMVVLPFSVFFVVEVVSFLFDRKQWLRENVKKLCILSAFLSIALNIFLEVTRFDISVEKEKRTNFYKAGYVMSQVKKPKVFYCSEGYGIGLAADFLPACRYWICQAGASKEMIEEREKDLKRGVADFVIIENPSVEKKKELESYGYVYYCSAPIPRYRRDCKSGFYTQVYGRPGLRLPPADFHVSQWDVWLKRNIFGI